MMGKAPFGLLKTDRSGPKSAEQAKTRLAILLKVLRATWFSGDIRSHEPGNTSIGCRDVFGGYG